MMAMRTFLVTALVLCGACSIYGGDDVEPVEVDGGTAEVDAAEVTAPPISVEQRDFECKLVCGDPLALCEGAGGGACWTECMSYATGSAYCPRI
jgi:hypothetical protein